jgi:hypothetical protein
MKRKKSNRIKDITIDSCYSVSEVADILRSCKYDDPVICKFGNRNFRIVSDKMVDDRHILILQ